jgi:hypothetical protein
LCQVTQGATWSRKGNPIVPRARKRKHPSEIPLTISSDGSPITAADKLTSWKGDRIAARGRKATCGAAPIPSFSGQPARAAGVAVRVKGSVVVEEYKSFVRFPGRPSAYGRFRPSLSGCARRHEADGSVRGGVAGRGGRGASAART